MLELFTNPGYLAAGGALVSAPIIIHLINRMRFRRVRWAAMEFLLKSQKRNRRRLIIEQLLLLMLRCLLVTMAALMVLRFTGCSGGFVSQDALHLVVLDDTLSMNDRWMKGTDPQTSFVVAKKDILLDGIVKSVGQSSTNERLAIIPLSKLVEEPDFQPIVYQKLNDPRTEQEIAEALAQLKPSQLHVPLVRGLKKAEALVGDHPEKRPIIHLISDFRQHDWFGPEAQELHKTLQKLAENNIKVRLTDAAHPFRTLNQSGVPIAHDNIGISDFRASTRVVGKGMPVTFTIEVANYSANDKSVELEVYDTVSGRKMDQLDFNPRMPLKVKAGSTATASFEMRLFPTLGANEKFYAQKLTAYLRNDKRTELGPDEDGLAGDNVHHAAVEVREKVPVLLVDGLGRQGREESKDSFFIDNAIASVPGGSYEVVYGDEVAGGNAVKALERGDLHQYPTLFLLNVPQLNKKQIANLENYVREGGGVAFFLGPLVDGESYTQKLYREGKGVFPAPLRKTFFPPRGEAELEPKFTGDPQLLIRDKTWTGADTFPIFGKVFTDEKQLSFLLDLPIRRYFPVPRSQWTPEPGKVFELATLPNDKSAGAFQRNVIALIEKMPIDEPAYTSYQPGLRRHVQELRQVVAPGSSFKSYQLAGVLDRLLTDRGDIQQKNTHPDLTQFWNLLDPKIRTLRNEVERLRDDALFGDPFVVAQRFGKGRVVAVMSTAGKDWNNWAGGSGASFIYQPFIWEMQNWLSSQASEANLMVGTPIKIDVDSQRFQKQGASQLAMLRTFYEPQPDQPAKVVRELPTFGSEREKGVQSFVYDTNMHPGFYLTELVSTGDEKTPLASWSHVFNVDTAREGRLNRISAEDLQQMSKGEEKLELHSKLTPWDDLINRQHDLSVWPAFFLIFLVLLISEQALAVHLSFHLRSQEGQMAAAAAPRPVQAA